MSAWDPSNKTVATFEYGSEVALAKSAEEALGYHKRFHRIREMANGLLRLHEACDQSNYPAVANLALDTMEEALELGWKILANGRNPNAPTHPDAAVEGLDGRLAALAMLSSADGH